MNKKENAGMKLWQGAQWIKNAPTCDLCALTS